MTIHETRFGYSVFYINKTKEGSYNYNRYNEKTNRTYHYSTSTEYYKAIQKAKNIYIK